MRITDVRHMTASIQSDIRNSVIDFSEMTVSLVALVSDVTHGGQPIVGYGFNSNGRYSQAGILSERFIPRLKKAIDAGALQDDDGRFDPLRVVEAVMVNEKPGGHGDRAVAAGVLDMAAWDLAAKLEGMPLYKLLHERFGSTPAPATRVSVYAAGGYYYPDKGLSALQDEMRGYLDLGYTFVKMKIGGAPLAEDMARIEAVLDVLPPGYLLAVDANARYSVEEAVTAARALSGYDLAWYEEPVDPNDFDGHRTVAEMYPRSLATGENLLSSVDVRNLVRHGGLRPHRDVLQMDPVLSYGLGEYLGTVRMLGENGWSARSLVPHGGHQFNLSIAAALDLGGCEAYPGVFEPFGGFADGERVKEGFVTVPDAPGLGLELKARLRPLLDKIAGR